MGEAKRRGNREQRVADAVAAANERERQRELAEMEREREIARQWALLPKDEQQKRLDRAAKDFKARVELAQAFGGGDMGTLVANVLVDASIPRNTKLTVKE